MPKKIAAFLMGITMMLSVSSCAQTSASESAVLGEASPITTSEPAADISAGSKGAVSRTDETDSASDGKKLVVYFSWSGNTADMAAEIARWTGAELLELEPTTAYPSDYNECGEIAKAERDENARPEIINLPESLEEYDTIFVGYPIWWHTAPMIIGTFLESYDLTGKEIYPFSQSASMDTEQFNNSMDFVRKCASEVSVHDGLFVRADDTDGIYIYLTENGFAELEEN